MIGFGRSTRVKKKRPPTKLRRYAVKSANWQEQLHSTQLSHPSHKQCTRNRRAEEDVKLEEIVLRFKTLGDNVV